MREYTIKIKISSDLIEDIISSAFGSAGITYWCDEVDGIQVKRNDRTYYRIHDAEAERWVNLTEDKIVKGLELCYDKVDLTNLDGPQCDMIVQYALFGEQLYA